MRRTLIAGGVILVCCALAASPAGQAQSISIAPSAIPNATDLAPLKQFLDQLQQTLSHPGLTDQSLAELREKLAPIRDGLRDRFDVLDPRLAEVDSRLSQLGPAPAAGAPPETQTVAQERAQLSQSRAEVDAALKETRLLSVRAEDLAARINESRRSLFSRTLLQRTPGVLDKGFWAETDRGFYAEKQGLSFLLTSWSEYARRNGGIWGVIASAAALIAYAALVLAVLYAWRRRFSDAVTAERGTGRPERALAALLVLMRHALIVPISVFVVLKVVQGNGLLLPIVADLGLALSVGAAVASFGRAIALAVLAPGAPHRRLVKAEDVQASRLASCLTWSARVLGAAIFLNLMHKSIGAPLSTTVATSAALAFLVALLVLYMLVRLPPSETSAGLRWLRFLAWVFAVAIAATLLTGFIGFAAFIAGRAIVLFMMIGVFYLGSALIDTVAIDLLSGESERGRRVAAMFGLSPRGLELLAMLLGAVAKLCLALLAIFPVLGPWGIYAADFFEVIKDTVFGVNVGNFSISIGAIIGAIALLLIGFLVTRAVQRWLDRRFLPRTGLDPGLQNSVSVLFGYAGFLAALVIALAELGIDLQKIALIAGALSVGIGFGLQSVVSNFVCGLILLAERPIRVGDWVLVKNEEGFVRRISVRATEIETFDRASVIVPNQDLITGVVKNMTHGNPIGRVSIKLGVGYDSDMDRVREILLELAQAHPHVMRAPGPNVFFMGFGVLALDVELRFFVNDVEHALSTRSDLNFAILRRFRELGIGIPTNPADVKLAPKPSPPVQ